MVPARELLTHRHSFFLNVDAKTVVYYVGEGVTSLTHQCEPRSGRIHPAPEKITMEQPAHVAKPAGLCKGCNRLYVAEDPPEVKSV